MKKLEKIRKNSTFMDKVCIAILVIFCLVLIPVGVGQYVMWYRGEDYSLVFMAMPFGFVFLLVAKFRAILER